MVDVDGVLTLIWCRKCAVWSTFSTLGRSSNHCKVKDPRLAYQRRKLEQGFKLNGIAEGLHLHGRSVPITKGEFERLFEVHDEGTCIAQCGVRHRMQKQIIASQKEEQRSTMMCVKPTRFAKRSNGRLLQGCMLLEGLGNVHRKIRRFAWRHFERSKEGRRRTGIRIINDDKVKTRWRHFGGA